MKEDLLLHHWIYPEMMKSKLKSVGNTELKVVIREMICIKHISNSISKMYTHLDLIKVMLTSNSHKIKCNDGE